MKILIVLLVSILTLFCPAEMGPIEWELIKKVKSIKRSVPIIKLPRSSYHKKRYTTRFYKHINSLCKQYNLPIEVMYSLISVESKFRPDARSGKGAHGLMQITKIALIEIERPNTQHTPRSNLKSGFKYYHRLYKKYQSHTLSLAAYNAGPSRVKINGTIPNIRETRSYVAKVLALSKVIKIVKEA